MMIAGLQKMTLLDYPGKVACTLFLQGCNFRCPFCHNSGLLDAQGDPGIAVDEFLAFLKKRQGLLDGVCITGGEPTLHKELPQLIRDIKALGFAVKLDTNGFRPDVLKAVAPDLDYVAMDIKNCPARYGETVGIPNLSLSNIQESMKFLMEGSLDYEFRTTVVRELHTQKDLEAMGQWFLSLSGHKVKKYFLQPYVDRDSVLQGGLHSPERADLQAFLQAIAPCVHMAGIRGDS